MNGEPATEAIRVHASLGRVLDHLGTTVLDIVAGNPDKNVEISGLVIYDPLDEPTLSPGCLVLGVGIQDSDQVADLLEKIGAGGAVGLVVRAPAPTGPAVQKAVSRTGTVLFEVTRGASWNQLAALLRSLLAEGDVQAVGEEAIGGLPAGDLFALANALASLLDAPVTFEDRSSRLLAFSGRQDDVDAFRVETILGRQVPERLTRMLKDSGVFRALYGRDKPIFIDPSAAGMPGAVIPRVAIAVRAGPEILGSIWVAVHEPLSPEREQALEDAAKLLALHLLRRRAGADVERRLRVDLVATVLEGGPGATDAATRLGLSDRPAVVLAMDLPDPGGEGVVSLAGLEADRQRAADALALHLSAMQNGAAVALLAGVAYAIVPMPQHRKSADERVAAIARDFLQRAGRPDGLIGVGRLAEHTADLPSSRADADRALRVLRSRKEGLRVARAADVHLESLLLELADTAGADGWLPTGPVARLLAYDARHGSQLVETLRAWLENFGDVIAASAAMCMHPNTFRYRLRRLAEVSELDLTDADARFAAMLQLRLLRVTGDPGRQLPPAPR